MTVRADNLRYVRGGRVIVDDVSVLVAPGQVAALVGPSGSGKSSLLALLAGLERPDSGVVRIDPPGARIGLILQAYGLVSLLTAAENVEIALQGMGIGRRDVLDRAARALDAVDLGDTATHLVEELSGGQQQRVAIARALAVGPDILLGDEVTAELDGAGTALVMDRLFEIARRGGSVVLATHDRGIAGRCDLVLRMSDGRVIVEP
jgi:putative ABC transport system ATP-binding protein